jgi:[ribosomal protein S18]-alanine N-acetyltransferase
MVVTIDPLTVADAKDCAAMEKVLFPGDDPWPARAFRDAVAAGHDYLAARQAGRLVGYAGMSLLPGRPSTEAEIHTIGVHPEVQGQGIGRALLRRLLADADRAGAVVFLEVRTDNLVGQKLYESEGFAVIGLRRRYYRPSGADAFTMRREPAAPAGRAP